jgi:type I restriction enzyme S subunit
MRSERIWGIWVLTSESKYIQRRLIEILNPVDEAMRLQAPISDNLQYLISSLFRSWFIDFDPVKAKAEGKLPYGMNERNSGPIS